MQPKEDVAGVSGPVGSKTQYYDLARRGWMGNSLPSYSVDEFRRLRGSNGTLYGIRAAVPGGTEVRYRLTRRQVEREISGLDGRITGLVKISPMAPDDRLTLQGEVMRTERGLYLRYNQTRGLSMREAYGEMKHAVGLTALLLLRRYLDADSMAMLEELLDRHPDAVVEFTAFDCSVGEWKRNTLFWEVRSY